MEKYLKTCLILTMLALIFTGCPYLGARKIQLETLALPGGARVLICEALQGVLTYEIKAFSRDIEIPGLVIVSPPSTGFKGMSLGNLVKDIIHKTPVDMVLIISPVDDVEKRYNPYQVFKGWRTRIYKDAMKDGRPVYRTKDEPVFETEYKHKCLRTTYRLFQYDKNGELMGMTPIKSADPQRCPETTDNDVHYDQIEVLISWLKSNISAK
ncbi:MAG: hypothetical protein ABII26_12050 [Pseudomonadota bacterium]